MSAKQPADTTIFYRGIAYRNTKQKPVEFYSGPDYHYAKKLAEKFAANGEHELIEVETISVTKTLRLGRNV